MSFEQNFKNILFHKVNYLSYYFNIPIYFSIAVVSKSNIIKMKIMTYRLILITFIILSNMTNDIIVFDLSTILL